MIKLGARWDSLGTVGTAVLGSLCLGGAAVYTAVVGTSLVSLPDAPTEAANLSTVSGLTDLPDAPVAALEVRVDRGEESYGQSLTCEGDPLADPAACAELAAGVEEEDQAGPFDEVAPGSICTEVVYGPETATISGVWEGVEIETEISRGDSCEEARWQRLKPLTDHLE